MRAETNLKTPIGAIGSYVSPIIGAILRRGWEALDFQPRATGILTQDLRRAVDRAVAGERSLPNAYLFTGFAGCGQEEAFILLAASARCTRPALRAGAPNPCWECGECRMILHGTHPDVVVVEPEGNTYLVELVRDRLVADSKFSAIEGGHRFVLVREAERLSRAASNALLRTVEEPSASVTFVLAAAPDRQAVLDTVASRCREVEFHPIPTAQMEAVLIDAGVEAEVAAAAATVSEGSLEGAAQAMQAGAYAEFTAYVARLVLPLFYDPSTNPLEVSGMLREHIEDVQEEVRSAIDDELKSAKKQEEQLGLDPSAGRLESLRVSRHRRLRRSEQALCLRVVTVLESIALTCGLLRAGCDDKARLRLEALSGGLGDELDRLRSAPAVAPGPGGPDVLDEVVTIAREARAFLVLNPRLDVWLDRLVVRVWAGVWP